MNKMKKLKKALAILFFVILPASIILMLAVMMGSFVKGVIILVAAILFAITLCVAIDWLLD